MKIVIPEGISVRTRDGRLALKPRDLGRILAASGVIPESMVDDSDHYVIGPLSITRNRGFGSGWHWHWLEGDTAMQAGAPKDTIGRISGVRDLDDLARVIDLARQFPNAVTPREPEDPAQHARWCRSSIGEALRTGLENGVDAAELIRQAVLAVAQNVLSTELGDSASKERDKRLETERMLRDANTELEQAHQLAFRRGQQRDKYREEAKAAKAAQALAVQQRDEANRQVARQAARIIELEAEVQRHKPAPGLFD